MPLIQTLFYFAGFTAFLLAAILFCTLLIVVFKNFKRLQSLMDTVEDKINAPLITTLMPFLPTIIALFGEFRKNRKK